MSTEEDPSSVDEVSSEGRSKRHRSPFPSFPECKEEELDEDPSYRQFLATVRSLLHLPTTDDSAEVPSKIFASRDRSKKKLAVLPTSLPPVEEINARWKALENKAEDNQHSEDAEKLRSTPCNSDAFLPYNRPLMKFYNEDYNFRIFNSGAQMPRLFQGNLYLGSISQKDLAQT